MSRRMRQLVQEEARRRGMTVVQLFGATNLNHLKLYSFQAIQQNAQIAKLQNQLAYVVVYSKEGIVGAHTEDPSALHATPSDPDTLSLLTLETPVFREIPFPFKASERIERVFDIVQPVYAPESLGRWATIRVGISSEPMHRHLRETQFHIFQIGIFCLLLGIVGSAILAAKITNPLVKLNEGSLRAAAGDLSSKISVATGDELQSLSENFNFMMDQIKKHQEERIRSEKLAAVGYMVNTIVHDCRTPITVIKGFASFLKEFRPSAEKREECLHFINFEVERMERMLDEILQFATEKKISVVLKPEVFDDFVKECCIEIEVLLKHTQIELLKRLNCGITVQIDRDRLRRAVLNVAANAREALKGSGQIRIFTEEKNSCAVLGISDTGPGIPEESKLKVFDPFFTQGKSMGFGLGMSITKKIVEDHKGEIQFDSKAGIGTTFTIRIPIEATRSLAKTSAT